MIPRAFFERPVAEVAPDLLGMRLVREGVVLGITEVEAYAGPEDSASHARHGRTLRNAPMWGEAGRAYLYFCYGMHWMLNVVTGPPGEAAAVLLRGAEVLAGRDLVLMRRNGAKDLCGGPGKLAQALALDGSLDGWDLCGETGLHLRQGNREGDLLAGPRVGIAFATPEDQARPWRFATAPPHRPGRGGFLHPGAMGAS